MSLFIWNPSKNRESNVKLTKLLIGARFYGVLNQVRAMGILPSKEM